MDIKQEENHEDDNRLSFFFDFSKELKVMKDTLAEKVTKALEDEFKGVKRASSEDLDSSACTVHSGDDDVPLASRVQKEKLGGRMCKRKTKNSRRKVCPAVLAASTIDDRICTRTRSFRRVTQEKNIPTSSVLPVSANDIVILSDSDDGDVHEVECLDSTENNTHVLSNISMDLNATGDLTFDDIEEDEDILVSVKINWMDLKMHRFELRKHQAFSTIFEELAETEKVAVDKILLILRDRIFISKEDTPESLKLSVIDIIEGGITKEAHRNDSERRELDKNMLEFKCVLKDQKKPLLVSIKKTDNMQCLMVKASEQLERPLEMLKFKFEGEELEGEATPEDLDLEGGEVIEVFVKS